jgi:hypothetical protein
MCKSALLIVYPPYNLRSEMVSRAQSISISATIHQESTGSWPQNGRERCSERYSVANSAAVPFGAAIEHSVRPE